MFQNICNNLLYTNQEKTIAYSLDADLPSGTTIDSDIAESLSQGLSFGGVFSLQSIVRHFIKGTVPNTSSDCTPEHPYFQENIPFRASCGIGAQVYCTAGRTPNPFSVIIVVDVTVNIGFSDDKLRQCGGVYRSNTPGVFELPSLCVTDSRRHCYPITTPYRILDTPVEFSATASTTSLGAYDGWGAFEYRGAGNLDGIAASIGDALKDALNATFRITSRPNCRPPVACDCQVDIRGLVIDFTGRSFEIGKYVNEESADLRVVSVQSPDNGWSIVRETRAGGFPQDTTQIDLECTESGWMALMTARCRRRVDGELVSDTTDQWAGVMQCSESCDGFYDADVGEGLFQVRTAGEAIPLGEVQDVEYLGRESSAVECEPPARPTFSVRQVEFC